VSLQAEGFEVSGDPIRLQQVFWNILRNAIKFTPERGAITVTARAELGVDFSVTISDTGIGLKATELKKVFEVFAQGDHAKSGAHRFGGLGLGLAISRKLVEMHSGTIEAFSDGPNLGATFVVRLPLLDAERPAAPLERGGNIGAADCPASNEGIHVLLVEDHEPTRLTLARLLTRRNYRVTTASTVSEARALAEQHQFNLVISDIGLPDGDGIELMKELHKLQNLKGIALTGYGMESDVQRSKDAGFGVHLTKPVRMQSLSAALMKLTS
jgi:CheY-like chemotaxis protein